MSYSYSDRRDELRDIYLPEFGETVGYTAQGHAARDIQAIIPRSERQGMGLPQTAYGPARSHYEAWISQDATRGVANPTKGVDTVRFRLEPGDLQVRNTTVTDAVSEYGMWRLTLQV
jgi:hypothetical protein